MNAVLALPRKNGGTVKGFMTATEVARRFNVTSRTVVRWIEDGELPGATKINSTISNSPFVIPVESVETLAKKKQEEAKVAEVTNDNGAKVT